MRTFNKLPPQAELNQLFEYDNGRLLWKESRRGVKAGTEAGSCSNTDGYRWVIINYRRYAAHRVIYTMHYGDIPGGAQIDHIDMQHDNNRIENLRLVSNQANGIARTVRRQSNNRTGVNGVSFYPSKDRYRAVIHVNGKNRHLGYYLTLEAAAAARRAAEVEHSYTALHNRPAA